MTPDLAPPCTPLADVAGAMRAHGYAVLAAADVGALAGVPVDASSSSTTKGETLRDTAQNIEALQADMIVIRHAAWLGAQLPTTHRSDSSSASESGKSDAVCPSFPMPRSRTSSAAGRPCRSRPAP